MARTLDSMHEPKPCRWCRERFTPKNGQQLYCSMQCSAAQQQAWRLARYKERMSR